VDEDNYVNINIICELHNKFFILLKCYSKHFNIMRISENLHEDSSIKMLWHDNSIACPQSNKIKSNFPV
jgi:hypothetical protein